MKLIARRPVFVPGKAPDDKMRGPLHSPQRNGDAGFDLQSSADIECPPGVITYVPTGVHVHAERGMWYTIAGRSSLTKKGGIVPFNVIDSEYQGELLVGVLAMPNREVYQTQDGNPSVNTYEIRPIRIAKDERIAQLLFFESIQPTFQQVREFPGSERGRDGFGSTGKM